MRSTSRKAIVAVSSLIVTATALMAILGLDRQRTERNFGTEAADLIHGKCDLAFRAFVRKNRENIGASPHISERFLTSRLKSRVYPILKEEEAHVIFAVERAFDWNSSNVPFQVWRRGNGNVTFQPIAPSGNHLFDGIEIDECGYLIGDDYPTRQRHSLILQNEYNED